MKIRFFRNVVANFVIFAVLCSVFVLSFGYKVMDVFSPPSVTPYYRGDVDKPNVSLMVNVYWGTEYLEPMLDVFDEYGVKTTFFIGGTWADKNPEILKEICDRGHELGNHGFFHIDHKKVNYAKNQEEILVTERLVESITGKKTALFAPPSGSFSTTTLNAADNLGYRIIMWSKDTIDWRDKDQSLVYSRCTKEVNNGDLILMHPTQHTLQALPSVLSYYRENGFHVVPVSENIGEEKQQQDA